MTATLPSLAPDPIRRPWCVRLAVALVLLGTLLNLAYLFNHCPLDLSPDESHYWEWSRHLDYGYYSKPPGIAWVIAGAVQLAKFAGVNTADGNALMPWIRLPAVLFGTLTGLTLLSLTRRIFRDDRAALAFVALSSAAPMFVVGGLLITIDSPMYLCWTLSLYFLWRYLDPYPSPIENRKSKIENPLPLYLSALFACLGMLFKPLLIAFPLCALVAMLFNPVIRARLKSIHSLFALLLILACQIPTIIWNARHHWVTFKHIGTQGGLVGNSTPTSFAAKLLGALLRELAFLGGQVGVLGGALAVFLALAAIHAFRSRRNTSSENTRYTFLLAFTLPLLAFYALLALFTNTEPNWPAAAYASGIPLLAGVVAIHWNHPAPKTRRTWRLWLSGTVILGLITAAVALNLHRLYPFIATPTTPLDARTSPRRWDPSAPKLRGNAAQAAAVSAILNDWTAQTHQPTHIVSTRYDTASSLAFYLPNQPFVYSIASRLGTRMSQYDLWPELTPQSNAGDNVLLVTSSPLKDSLIDTVIAPAFDHLDRDPATGKPLYQRSLITVSGIPIREVYTLQCSGFRGWPPSSSAPSF
jgi:4-amino-4-deoxy-L-arabinose transferase-like glycosyltransferase